MSYEKRREKFLQENKKQRLDFIKLLATKIRETNFSKELKKNHIRFLDSQIEISNNFWKKQREENPKYFKKHFKIKI